MPRNDPTLMFTNAGMVQFKNVFTGAEKRPYNRATTAQKCVRAGGKHNDLDNVGYTARHHTFFEMIGQLLVRRLLQGPRHRARLEPDHQGIRPHEGPLLVTVYHDDEEAVSLWKRIAGFSDSKIIRIPTSDNFWQMGDTGPCGPCSEIFIDQGDALQGGPPGSPDEDGDRFLEFWNLVFMQYEQIEPGNRSTCRKPSIDTGMGLERMAAILQGVHSNYDTDLFRTLIEAVAHATGVAPRAPARPPIGSSRITCAPRRSSSPTACCRRTRAAAMCFAASCAGPCAMRSFSARSDPLMYRLVPALVREMGQAYPELIRAEPLITETLKLEETRFRKTLERGLVDPRRGDPRADARARTSRARPPSRSTTPSASRSTSRRTR